MGLIAVNLMFHRCAPICRDDTSQNHQNVKICAHGYSQDSPVSATINRQQQARYELTILPYYFGSFIGINSHLPSPHIWDANTSHLCETRDFPTKKTTSRPFSGPSVITVSIPPTSEYTRPQGWPGNCHIFAEYLVDEESPSIRLASTAARVASRLSIDAHPGMNTTVKVNAERNIYFSILRTEHLLSQGQIDKRIINYK